MVLLSDQLSMRVLRLPRVAHSVDVEQYFNERVGESLLGNLTLTCPICGGRHRPFRLSRRKTQYKGTSYPWHGVDYQDVLQHYTSICPRTGKPYRWDLLFPQ